MQLASKHSHGEKAMKFFFYYNKETKKGKMFEANHPTVQQ